MQAADYLFLCTNGVLLYVYGVQLHHFTPNALLHVACFITLCECFLGVHPHWGLWKRIFFVKRQGGAGVGSFEVSIRPDVEYFDIRMLESVQGWRKKWFYVRDETNAAQPHGLPPFEAGAEVKKKRSWEHDLSATEAKEADRLLARIKALQNTAGMEVSGIHLISTFIRRRVQPLQARIRPMWEYEGSQDSTRIHKGDLSDEDLEKRVQGITTLKVTDPCADRPPVAPYGEGEVLPAVSLVLLVLSLSS